MHTKPNDRSVTLADARTMVQKFCEARGWDAAHGPKDLAISIVTEASELLEIFRYVPEARLADLIADPSARGQIADELADCLYGILRFAQMNKFDLATCLSEKLVKNALKYPATHQ